jgi:hypothetical protein
VSDFQSDSNSDRRLPRRWLPLAAIPFSSAAALLLATPAGALTSCTGYNYSGQESVNFEGGVEGNISNDTALGIPAGYTTSHNLNYLSMDQWSNTGNPCTGSSDSVHCWLQVGYGIGELPVVGSHCGAQSQTFAYEENSDVNGYDCTWEYPISLQAQNYYSDFLSGTTNGSCPGADALWDGYINTGAGPILIGNAWLPLCGANANAYASAEGENTVPNTGCPTWQPYQFFGGTSNSELDLSPKGSTWGQWSSSDPITPFTNFSTTNVAPNYEFKMYN